MPFIVDLRIEPRTTQYVLLADGREIRWSSRDDDPQFRAMVDRFIGYFRERVVYPDIIAAELEG